MARFLRNSGLLPGDMTRFTGLTGLKSVGEITNPGTLEGLEGLERIEGALTLKDSYLRSLAPLVSLRDAGSILIDWAENLAYDNLFPSLESVGDITLANVRVPITGFNRLEVVRGHLDLQVQESPDFDAFHGLKEAGSIAVEVSLSTSKLNAFSSLVAVEGPFEIRGQDLDDLSTLNALEICGRFSLFTTQDEVQGLTSLETVEGNFETYLSWGLTHLDNFASLTHVGGDIVVNWNISQRALDRFLSQIQSFQGRVQQRRSFDD